MIADALTAEEKATLEIPIQCVDPMQLPEPWCWIVSYWIHHIPDRLFLPDLEDPTRWWLDWDDLQAIYTHAGVLPWGLPAH